jgi:hypothetical protein
MLGSQTQENKTGRGLRESFLGLDNITFDCKVKPRLNVPFAHKTARVAPRYIANKESESRMIEGIWYILKVVSLAKRGGW